MLWPTEEMSRGVGRAMSSRARRTATTTAAAMIRVVANFAFRRARSSLASARAMWPMSSSIGEQKANIQTVPVDRASAPYLARTGKIVLGVTGCRMLCSILFAKRIAGR